MMDPAIGAKLRDLFPQIKEPTADELLPIALEIGEFYFRKDAIEPLVDCASAEVVGTGMNPTEALASWVLAHADPNFVSLPTGRRCRVCGCTDLAACPGGCWWVEDGLCSSCAAKGEMTR